MGFGVAVGFTEPLGPAVKIGGQEIEGPADGLVEGPGLGLLVGAAVLPVTAGAAMQPDGIAGPKPPR